MVVSEVPQEVADLTARLNVWDVPASIASKPAPTLDLEREFPCGSGLARDEAGTEQPQCRISLLRTCSMSI